MIPNPRITLLLAAFGRALSHQVRTPLSVISNDLFYLQTLIAPEECQRSLERCKSISDILAAACQVSTRPPSFEAVRLDVLLRDVFACLITEQCSINGDGERLRQAFSMLSELLALESNPACNVSVCRENGNTVVKLIAPMPPFDVEELQEPLQVNSFTEVFNICGRQDRLTPMYIDAILWENGACMKLELEQAEQQARIQAEICFRDNNE